MSRPAAKWSTALHRFGMGARGLASPPPGDPREALEAELSAAGAGLLSDPNLPSGAQALRIYYDYAESEAAARAKADALRGALVAMPAPNETAPPRATSPYPAGAPMDPLTVASPPPLANPIGEAFLAEAGARIAAACAAPVGFVERLVAFWSNHFCVSTIKGLSLRASAGAFEREAIRPFVLGRFRDMLFAVERHQAMLLYLDNAQSVGPNSPQGRRIGRGLNENLARETLELHTLGVDGGYTQADVTELARILTGWTVTGRESPTPGIARFNFMAHEPGARVLLGRDYAEAGAEQSEAALADLARAPATARHIAAKFARAFVADSPSPALVARLAESFTASDGDLGALARALLADDEAWSAPPTQLRDPWQMMIAAYRALGLDVGRPNPLVQSLAMLGMPLWSPGGPNGFPESADAWASPEGIKTRVEIAAGLGRTAKSAAPPRDLVDRILPHAAEATRRAVLGAESRPQAYALMLLAPEFQRR